MVWDQGPCVALGLGFLEDDGEAIEERSTIFVIFENHAAFNSSGHYLLQEAGGLKPGLARHFFIRPQLNRLRISRGRIHEILGISCLDLIGFSFSGT